MTNEATLLDSLPISEHWKQLLSNPIFKLGMFVGSEWASTYYDAEIKRLETEADNNTNDAYQRGINDVLRANNMLELEELTPSHPIFASVFLSTSF